MTSLIDMMFLLVIFVLVAARFEPSTGLKVTLPPGGQPLETSSRPLTVFATRDAEIFLEEDPVTLEDFSEVLAGHRARFMAENGGDEPVLLIYGDQQAPWGLATELIQAARRAGQSQFNIRTRTTPHEE